ncbi:ribosome silencing factor [Legionella sp. D16C41]|uniref:ribosome silencing factor n=1 Tax=Legionella sp. D16C41 TaxID=3402688 RepID=UPI003AF65284
MLEQPSELKKLHTILDDNQAIDIVIIDVSKQTSVTDFMVICSGRSSRHIRAIAMNVLEKMKLASIPILGSHGLDSGEWALIDFGDFVLHIMQADTRAFYNLEGLWQENP